MTLSRKDSITVQKESLYRLAYTVPLSLAFLYFTKMMLFGPSTIWMSGVFVSQDLSVTFQDNSGQVYLTGQFDFTKANQEPNRIDFCRFRQNGERVGCLEERNNQQVKVQEEDSEEEDVICHTIERKGLRCTSQMIKDCYNLNSAHWYGGFQTVKQFWPLKKAVPTIPDDEVIPEEKEEDLEISLTPYIMGDPGLHSSSLVNAMERIFFSSTGVAIIILDDTPLHMSFNQHGDGKLCIGATQDRAYYFNQPGKQPKLEYKVCKARDVKTIHDYLLKNFIPKPEAIPDQIMMSRPIWSTWAVYKKDINQSSVLQYADKISALKLPIAQLEIDDGWTTEYGDLTFDPLTFPDPKKMISQLTSEDIPVTLWVHPFISLKADAFTEATGNKFTITAKGSEVPALVKWWNEDMAALLDVTNPAAVLWFQNKLMKLKEVYNVTSFKFDGGEGLFVPASHDSYTNLISTNDYSTQWAELAHTFDPIVRRQEVRVGWKSQRLPIMLRLFDRMSTWDRNGGLQSIIPSVFTMGILGYPFVLPDKIGGNVYVSKDNSETGEFPEKELYIRWLQACLFMPSLQFSVPPWIYDEEVVSMTQKLLALRESYASKFISLAEESVKSGNPIIRPLWWVEPNDEKALVVEDEFLVGNDFLVAPMLVKGARKRNIYLPTGSWNDMLRGKVIEGPTTLEDYAVTLYELPTFEKIVNEE